MLMKWLTSYVLSGLVLIKFLLPSQYLTRKVLLLIPSDYVLKWKNNIFLETHMLVWLKVLDVSDTFSISSARRFLDGGMFFLGGTKTRWNNLIPIKINILICKITLLSIPTRERLSHRGITIDSILCPICFFIC